MVGDLWKNFSEDVIFVFIYVKEEDVLVICFYLLDVYVEVIDYRRWVVLWYVIEIIKSGMNKVVGLQKISDYYDVLREWIIVFGDEDNDLEMFEFVGCGVVMGNGIDEVKQIVNWIMVINEEDGVVRFLKEYFLF